jgi:threonine dehydratase
MAEADKIYQLIQEADTVLDGVIHRTPLSYSHSFSKMVGANIYLKLENLQKTGAFKVRGAYFKIHSILDQARMKGVIAASSGNHAQGVAYAANELGVKATIVMPETTPPYKVIATKSYGAEVLLHGRVYDDAYTKAIDLSRKTGAVFIHPFDDPYVIAGQGTIGLEIVKATKDVDYILVPVGGGGLISGIAIAVKKLLGNKVKVIGIEPEAAPKFNLSIKEGKPVVIKPNPSLADGVVTKTVGKLTLDIVEEFVDDIVTVDEDSIARAIYLLLERAKLLAEGAGALPLAALLSGAIKAEGKYVVAVISGGNADLTTLYRVILKGLMVEGRIAKLTMILKDVPGMLHQVLGVIASNRCNIIEIKHDRFDPHMNPGNAAVEVIMETPSKEAVNKVVDELKSRGVKVVGES